MDKHKTPLDRRQVTRLLMIGGAAKAVSIPAKWARPLVAAVFVPAHAMASVPVSSPTTSIPPA